jgi:hypothetical protein
MTRTIETYISRELESGEEVEFTVTLEVHPGRRASRSGPAEETTADVVSVKDSEGRDVDLTEEEEESLTSGDDLYRALEDDRDAMDAAAEDAWEASRAR